MIISGIYLKQNGQDFSFKNIHHHSLNRLYDLTQKKIKGPVVNFQNRFLTLIAGKTSAEPDGAHILSNSEDLLIGKVFNKKNNQKITYHDFQKISKKSNAYFVDNYWGNYIFIQTNSDKTSILRDPVGQFPLFYTENEHHVIFSSEINILYDFIEKKPAIHWGYFASYMMNSFITSKFTAFEKIFELPHGCELTLSKDLLKTSVVWNPLNYIDPNNCPERFEDAIIQTTSHTLKSWLDGSESILVDFSGGLDSSSLLFLTKNILQKNQHLFPVNWFHPQVRSSDEREHAQKVARELGLEPILLNIENYLPFSSLEERPGFRPNWPNATLSHLALERHLADFSKIYPKVSFMSGHGGDHIFLCPPILMSLVDSLIQKGIGNYHLKLKELAAYYRCSVFPLLKFSLKGLLSYLFVIPTYEKNLNKKTPWFKKEFLDLAKAVTPHPFFEKRRRILPGKYQLLSDN